MNNTQCPICLEQLESNKNICTTECGHQFCLKCMLQHCRKSSACPLCRQLVPGANEGHTTQPVSHNIQTQRQPIRGGMSIEMEWPEAISNLVNFQEQYISKFGMIKLIQRYIIDNNLRDSINTSFINPDELLRNALQLQNEHPNFQLTYFNLPRFVCRLAIQT